MKQEDKSIALPHVKQSRTASIPLTIYRRRSKSFLTGTLAVLLCFGETVRADDSSRQKDDKSSPVRTVSAPAVVDARNTIVGASFSIQRVFLKFGDASVVGAMTVPASGLLEWSVTAPGSAQFTSSDCTGMPLLTTRTDSSVSGARPALQVADANGDVWVLVGTGARASSVVVHSMGSLIRPGRTQLLGTVVCHSPNIESTAFAVPLEQSINLTQRYPEPLGLR